ncbi:MAG: hypothetical protein ACKOXK_03950 [Chakrabartia sp.]
MLMLKSARQRAKKAGVPFAITKDDLLIPAYCPVFGIKLERSLGSKGPGEASPTLDRIVPERGYVPGNIVIISNRANRAKSNLTPDELIALADFFKNNRR